jgi:hypothetical protein
MVSIRFVAQDLVSKECTHSTPLYFDKVDEVVKQLINVNRQRIQMAMPFARVLALIENEEDSDDNLFT